MFLELKLLIDPNLQILQVGPALFAYNQLKVVWDSASGAGRT